MSMSDFNCRSVPLTRWHAFARLVCNWSTTQCAGRRGAFDVYARHTHSLYDRTWIEMPVSFCSHILSTRTMCFSRRLRLLGIGGDTQTDISYSPMLWRNEWVLTDAQYRSNTRYNTIWYNMTWKFLTCVKKLASIKPEIPHISTISIIFTHN